MADVSIWADLHVHSTYSDGNCSVDELVQTAVKASLRAISIVDHDSVDGIDEALRLGEQSDVQIVPGLELSSEYSSRDIHILAYLIDYKNEGLVSYIGKFRDARVRRAEKMVEILNSLSVGITIEEVLKKSGCGSVGRPHIAEVMVEGGFVRTTQEAFDSYIGYNGTAYADKFRISPKDAINLIHSAGGLAVLAHPGIALSDGTVEEIISFGIDGIEVAHPKHDQRQVQRYRKIACKHDLLETAGSDFHAKDGAPPMGSFGVSRDLVGKMKGKAEKIRQDNIKGGNDD